MQPPQLSEITSALTAGFLSLLVFRRIRWSPHTEARQRRFIQRHGLLRRALLDSLILVPAAVSMATATWLQAFSPVWFAIAALIAIAGVAPPAVLAMQPRMDRVDLSEASIESVIARRRKSAPIFVGILLLWLWPWFASLMAADAFRVASLVS